MPDAITLQPDGIWAVVPAGGNGTRYATGKDKLLVPLEGVPVLARTVMALLSVPSINGIVVVSSEANRERYQSVITNHIPKATQVQFASGGATRRESVYNGLLALPELARMVIVHDAARPLIRPALIEQAIQGVREGNSGAIVAIPIHDTVKETVSQPNTDPESQEHPMIRATLDRNRLWRAQTPQVFQKDVLLQAHQEIPLDIPVTDDAQLLELAGLGPVAIVPGDERNLKITRPIDVLMAEAFLKANAVPLL